MLKDIKARIPEIAKDLRLNLSSVMTCEGAPGLSEAQIHGVALASAIASRNRELTAAMEAAASEALDDGYRQAAHTAAAVMAMNNIYYRFIHLLGDEDYARLPAKLRMSAIARPGIERTDFELMSLAVSAINGCGQCVQAHEQVLRKAGFSREAIQSAVRIASVIHAVAVTLEQHESALVQEAA